jgi:O-antigen/teichoic acid export membrane protein
MEDRKQAVARVTIHGTLWMYASFYSGRLVVFVSTIVLARLLTQEDYGVAGYALVFIAFLDVIGDLGIGTALIYHRDDPEAIYTGFWLNLGTGLGLFVLTWLAAPLVGEFYHDPRAVGVTRALAVSFPISALGNMHSMLLYKQLAFGRRFLPNLVRNAGKGATAILLALLGFGPWSLIWGQVAGAVLAVIAFWWAVPWRPALRFYPEKIRPLLSYGLKMISLNFLSVLGSNMDYLFVGRYLGAASLGVYTLAFRIPDLLISQACNIVTTVAFPVYASLRDEPHLLKQSFLATNRYLTILTVPIGVGLALVAGPIVLTFFTNKWAEAIPVVPAIALYAMIVSFFYNAGDVFKAQGRPGLLVKITLVEVAIMAPAMWWAVTGPASIVAVGWVHVAVAAVERVLNLIAAVRLLHLSLLTILDTLRPALVSGGLMALAIAATLHGLADTLPAVQLMAGVSLGALVYIGSLYLLERELCLSAGTALRSALMRR